MPVEAGAASSASFHFVDSIRGIRTDVLIFLAGLTVALAVSAVFSWRQRRQDERRFLEEQLAGFGRPIERERDLGRLVAWLEALGYPPAVVSAAHAAVGATDARKPEPPPG